MSASPNPSSSSTLTTYAANCHCGLVKFTLSIPPLAVSPAIHTDANAPTTDTYIGRTTTVISCNCSMCASHGLLMIHCNRSHVVFSKGYENLAEYRYRTSGMVFRFCPGCGTSVMWDLDKPWGEEMEGGVGLNARTIQGVDDLAKLKYFYYDGRAQGDPYVVPE